MSKKPAPEMDLVPSLREVVNQAGFSPEKLTVAFETDDADHVRIPDKHTLYLAEGGNARTWGVKTLSELFRGNRMPPSDMDHYPEEYTPYFYFIEHHVLALSDVMGPRTDQEMEEIYFALRRRPDGRSLGMAHDAVWQVSALLLGSYPLSQAEFEALLGALIRSTRKWSQKPVSRNYVQFLRKSFGSGDAGED